MLSKGDKRQDHMQSIQFLLQKKQNKTKTITEMGWFRFPQAASSLMQIENAIIDWTPTDMTNLEMQNDWYTSRRVWLHTY